MKEFESLIEIIDQLLGPGGCPWDQEQTLKSTRGALIEETYEVIEAIDLNETDNLKEELGDLFFNVIFLSKLAEKEGHFNLPQVLSTISEKLIRRHPHVFGKAEVQNTDEVIHQWEAIKKEEKHSRQSLLDGIPKDIPSLFRAEKMLKKFKKAAYDWQQVSDNASQENQAGEELLELIQKQIHQGIEPELALRKLLALLEHNYRKWEIKS
ncbi:MAG: MazG family protein [Candidatus Protochlamydia sp.]|nr:MazG family protein [Candidatus Protochlamydia sp.]